MFRPTMLPDRFGTSRSGLPYCRSNFGQEVSESGTLVTRVSHMRSTMAYISYDARTGNTKPQMGYIRSEPINHNPQHSEGGSRVT